MKWFFNMDNPVMRTLSMLADIVILNLLTLFCSLPIITAGAAVAKRCFGHTLGAEIGGDGLDGDVGSHFTSIHASHAVGHKSCETSSLLKGKALFCLLVSIEFSIEQNHIFIICSDATYIRNEAAFYLFTHKSGFIFVERLWHSLEIYIGKADGIPHPESNRGVRHQLPAIQTSTIRGTEIHDLPPT